MLAYEAHLQSMTVFMCVGDTGSLNTIWTSGAGTGVAGDGQLNIVGGEWGFGSISVDRLNATTATFTGMLVVSSGEATFTDCLIVSSVSIPISSSITVQGKSTLFCSAGGNRVKPNWMTVTGTVQFLSFGDCLIYYPPSTFWAVDSTAKLSLTDTNVWFGLATFTPGVTVVNTNSVFNISSGWCSGQFIGIGSATFVCRAPIPNLANCTGTGNTGFTFIPSAATSGTLIISSGCRLNSESLAPPTSNTHFQLNGGTIARGATFRGTSCALNSGTIIGPTTANWLTCASVTGPPADSTLVLTGATTGSITISPLIWSGTGVCLRGVRIGRCLVLIV